MSAPPFFSIAIPSKNRPDRLEQAVRSVLDQTMQDFEIVVCDNSDEREAEATAVAVRAIGDPRIVYIRTSGRLSMPDNWEHAIAHARGAYVGILTDRSLLIPTALERAHRQIEATGVPLVGWFGDSYGRGPSGRDFRRRPRSGQAWLVESRRLLDYFVHGHFKHASKRLPKLMTAVCAREVLDRIRTSPVGRVCPPVCPDYTSGYLMLAHTDRLVLIDDALFISCGSGNGSAFRRRGPLADRFLRDLGMSWESLVDRMPTQACFTTALVLNDLMRVKERDPARFAGLDVDRVQYYLGCLADYEKAARRGAELFDDYDALLEGLQREHSNVQAAVRTRSIYLRAATVLPPDADGFVDSDDDGDGDGESHPLFDSVFQAMAWAATHPAPRAQAPATETAPLPMPSMDGVSRVQVTAKRRPLRMSRAGIAAPPETE